MKQWILAVDDEALALSQLVRAINEAIPNAEIHAFQKVKEALDLLQSSPPPQDGQGCIAFLDIEMAAMTGIELAKCARDLCTQIQIIFVTGYSEYALEAYRIHARGYVMKPVTSSQILEELSYCALPENPIKSSAVQVQCFGNFGVFVDGKPLRFKYTRTLELLAYLVDRKGAFCSNDEIMCVMWDDDPSMIRRKSFFRDIRADLLNTLSALGHDNIIARQRGKIAVIPEMISCDYYDMINGKVSGIDAYHGEYMQQYSWGELTLGKIIMKSNEQGFS